MREERVLCHGSVLEKEDGPYIQITYVRRKKEKEQPRWHLKDCNPGDIS